MVFFSAYRVLIIVMSHSAISQVLEDHLMSYIAILCVIGQFRVSYRTLLCSIWDNLFIVQ